MAVLSMAALGPATAACSSGSSSPKAQSPAARSNALVEKGLAAESTGQTTVAVSDFESAAAANGSNQYAYYNLGVIYQQEHDVTDASAAYHKALLASPNYKPALFNLAVLETEPDPTEAVNLYEQLLTLNPDDPNVNFNLGLLLVKEGQGAAGLPDVAKAIKLDPSLKSRLPPGVPS